MRHSDMWIEKKGVIYFDPVPNYNTLVGCILPLKFGETAPPKATAYFEKKKKNDPNKKMKPRGIYAVKPANIQNEHSA